MMKQLQLDSPEFNQLSKNMQLEKLDLSHSFKKKALEIVNSGIIITPALIK